MSRIHPRIAGLALGVAILSAAPVTSAEAQYYYRRPNHGAALAGGIAGGVLGGLAAGAIISATRPGPVYAAPAPVYVEPPPVYAAPEPVYVPSCHIVRRKVWLDDYAYTYRRERVCD
ncbi:MAG: hypothetical protein ACRCTI_17235 [Beijerinckiaceae bacterium]